MIQDFPSYIANDAAPLFPEFMEGVGSDQDPPPERLAFYALHTEEGLKAFLYDVYWIGYPGLFIAVNHVWSLLIAPRAYHCTLMGQMSGAGGSGKQALTKTLKQFIGEALETWDFEIPTLDQSGSLEAQYNQVSFSWAQQEEQVQLIVAKYAAILNGNEPERVHPNGIVIRGPWNLALSAVAGCSRNRHLTNRFEEDNRPKRA
jgi:hypothetical protein